ncbi:CCA tRNA nucleotidyltransferase [Enterococcus sp. BWT-B8]|uniref:CCA tRNA nucleotidyltransferase n=1 Tax=Enterococcus sp. BWT-B8 TaxID=2885157 RepID=UPI001E3DB639|nr:CCA tRNA nucleotidyltransferase [Enterococcus sp. BWT-B8]MCB5950625.1 CCA tRNA nucleotidyltransferase [Enterococcus sp. BWT-B8]
MKLDIMPEEFVKALGVIKEIELHGFEAYFVGGSVRDALLGKKSHDVDIATSAYPEEIKRIFKRTVDVGIDHGTVLVLYEDSQYEITTFRTESTYQDFRRPDKVTFVRSLEEDLKRRDFTINALALDKEGTVIDLFHGLDDLKNGVIRAVGNPKERFHEDALRMMRGLRFASQLDFTIETETLKAIYTFHELLSKISVERISVEFSKLLLGNNRQKGFSPFIETECYRNCPGLAEHLKGLLRFSELPNFPIEEERQAWALLIKELSVPNKEIRLFLKKWKLSNQMMHETAELVYCLNKRLEGAWLPEDLYRAGLDRALAVEKLLSFYNLKGKLKETEEQFLALPIKERKHLAITGNDLMTIIDRKPGKWLGLLIDYLEKSVINNEIPNDKEMLISCSKKIIEQQDFQG